MKIFKKAISLVLVFAMIASFAGMTGYEYSPMSIEAQAYSDGVGEMVTYTFDGGYSVKVAKAWYKTTYNYSGVYPIWLGPTNMPDDYYGVPYALEGNDLSITFTAPSGGAWAFYQFLTDRRTDGTPDLSNGGNAWGAGGLGGTSGGFSAFDGALGGSTTRGESTFERDELGSLFGNNLNSDEKQGFRDIDTIYLVFAYKVDDVIKYGYIDVALVDYEKKDDTITGQWTVPATTDKPVDSAAGMNQMYAWEVPATLYKDSSNQIMSTVSGTELDTSITIDVPTGTKWIKYSLSTDPSKNGWTTFYEQSTDPTEEHPFSYTGWGVYGDEYYEVCGRTTAAPITVPSHYLYYRLDYKVDVEFADGTVREVTYSQFAFSWVMTLPRFKVGYAFHSCLSDTYTGWGSRRLDSHAAMYQEINFVNFIADGFNMSYFSNGPTSSEGGTDADKVYDSTTAPTTNWGMTSWSSYDTNYSAVRLFRFGYENDEQTNGYEWNYLFLPGYGMNGGWKEAEGSGGTNNITAMGAKLYYDPQATYAESINASLTTTQHNVKGTDDSKEIDTWAIVTQSATTYGWSYKFRTYDELKWNDVEVQGKNSEDNGNTGITMSGSWVPSDGARYYTTTPNLVVSNSCYNGTAKNVLLLFRSEMFAYRESTTDGDRHRHENFFSYALEFVPVDRSTEHAYIEKAIQCNYVEEEMDPDWWSSYQSKLCEAYKRLGYLSETGTFTDSADYLNKPKYVFADYSDLSAEILTAGSWERGSTTGAANTLVWGSDYEEWNATTHANGGSAGGYAVYDLTFDGTDLYINKDVIRDGSYYYTDTSWSKYVTARNNAVAVYNYATSGTFDYDTAYPDKTPTSGDKTVGLACYWKNTVDQAALTLKGARQNLVKKDGESYTANAYNVLVGAASGMAYDGESTLSVNTGKHGFVGIYSSTNSTHYYDSASLKFRANAPDDVYSYVYTEASAAAYNAANPDKTQVANGYVVCDDDGNPLYCLNDNETPNDTSDDKTVLACADSDPDTDGVQPYDTGILAYPNENGTRRPVGQGNTFTQLLFDNSVNSAYAVTSARTALYNRLRWYKGGGATGYEWLAMTRGAYTANEEGTGENTTKLTEELLATNGSAYMWTGVEHVDDIYKAAYAILRVSKTIRLATNYREVVGALNYFSNGVTKNNMPAYDIGGTEYVEQGLYNVTIFHGYYNADTAPGWDKGVVATYGTTTYRTSGRTWYTWETWSKFIEARDKLASLVYNGSTGTTGDEAELDDEFFYDQSLAGKYYTYDVKLGNGTEYTNTYYTNGEYVNNLTATEIEERGIENLAAEGQDAVNTLVDNYLNWFDGDPDNNELVLKNLDEYTWAAYNKDSVSTIQTQVDTMLAEIVQPKPYYDFTSTISGDSVEASLDTSKTITLYDPTATAELQAMADAIDAYLATDNLGDKAVAFDTALTNYKAKYDSIISAGYYCITGEFNEILTHLSTLTGVSITTSTLKDKFAQLYTDTDGKVAQALADAIDAYDAAVAGGNDQALWNTAVESLYNALNGEATSVEVINAANTAIAYPELDENKFNIYNYKSDARAGTSLFVTKYTDDSVATLTSDANDAKDKPYHMLRTYASTITADVAEVNALTSKLVEKAADTTYLKLAIEYAKGVLYDENGEVKSTPVENPAKTQTVNVPNFSEQSIKELQATIAEAETAIAAGYTWNDQLEIDKLTWAIFEETEDATSYLLVANAEYYSGLYGAPYTWSTVDGVTTRTGTDSWEDSYYKTLFYGTRKESFVGLAGYGLQEGPAYYGFLDAEYKATTVVKFNDDGTVASTTDYAGTVWNGDGSLVYTDNKVAVGETTFTNWSSYMEYYNQYASISTDLTISSQDTINTLAANIYRTRNALTLSYFPSNTNDFAEAMKLFNALKSYESAVTYITRYGYAPDDEGYVTYGEDSNLVAGEATQSAKQAVTLYTNITDEYKAAVSAFEAKYASYSSTEPYDSIEKAQALYNEIYNKYLNVKTADASVLITAKPQNHDDFTAGMNDLTANYIAGTWSGTSYTSDLLNSTQISDLNTALGNAQAMFTDSAATEEFGTSLAAYTDIVFNYTLNPATNLKFADAMRRQVEGFMGLTIDIKFPEFYNGGATVTVPIFDQYMANQFMDDINTFYEKYEWPCIYQIHGLEVKQSASGNTKGNWFVTKYPSGEETGACVANLTMAYSKLVPDDTDNAVDNKIYELFTKLGGQSKYYSQIIDHANTYHTESLEWLLNNAIVSGVALDDGSDAINLILADLDPETAGYGTSSGSTVTVTDAWLTALSGEDTTVEVNYDVRKDDYWYSEGCGITYNSRTYYNYSEWFTSETTGNLNTVIYGDDEDVDSVQDVLDKYKRQFTAEGTGLPYTHSNYIRNNCWNLTKQESLVSAIENAQSNVDTKTSNFYMNIRALELLPATEAYRNVINAYMGLYGKSYTWTTENVFDIVSADDYTAGGTDVKAEDGVNTLYTFYNGTDEFEARLGGTTKWYAGATPAYGTVYGITSVDYKDAEDYEGYPNDAQSSLTAWYDGIKATTNDTAVTIDMAVHVYSYDTADGITSLYEEFVSYASKLELNDFDSKWLDWIVQNFLQGTLNKFSTQETVDKFATMTYDGDKTFASKAAKDGKTFYEAKYYTTDSLKDFAYLLQSNNVVKDVITNDELIALTTDVVWETLKGSYYDSAKQDAANRLVVETLIPEINSCLVLLPASYSKITDILETDGATAAYNNKSLYATEYTYTDADGAEHNAWNDFVAAYDAALEVIEKCKAETGYYTEAEDSAKITAAADALSVAYGKIKLKADSAAPQIDVAVDSDAVKKFYTTYKTDLAAVDTVTDPVAGTLFMPNNGGYSLLVYTNEVNPRIYLDIQDVGQDLNGDNTIDISASKTETLSVSSKRTSGTVTNLIYGTMTTGEIKDVTNRNLKTSEDGPLSNYSNTAMGTGSEKDSSVFAILAPTFNTANATAAAIYTITVRDTQTGDTGVISAENNYSTKLVIGGQEIDVSTLTTTTESGVEEKSITVYIYYHNSMPAADEKGNINDEGIVYDADGKLTGLDTPANKNSESSASVTHVASVIFGGELEYAGTWRNGISLLRSFDSTLRSWEFMSQLNDGTKLGTVTNVTFDDPTFGDRNLGSFYYVFNKSTESEIYSTYTDGKNSDDGYMDYDRATAAKTAMIAKINAMSDDDLATFKDPTENTGFYYYGATDAAGNYVNWAQVLNDKVENGDLVFVHVVDRWGNVVNRIIEITNLDKIAPVVASSVTGEVTITENGGAGVKDITVHNGDFSLGSFTIETTTTQKLVNGQIANNAKVDVASSTFTISGLVPGKTYYIGAYDNASNAHSTGLEADSDGKIAITIADTSVATQSTEDGEIVYASSSFTLNGTDVITINAGAASSVINAAIEGNVFAERVIRHKITTLDTVSGLKTVHNDGTVEEWTSSNATVTDNGDGTLTWTIKRTLTEGEHIYNVYALVDGEYETFYATADIIATTRSVSVTLGVNGPGSTVITYGGSINYKCSSYKLMTVPYGSKVSFSASTSVEGCQFYYWTNNTTKRIISTADVYEFTAVTDVDCKAQFTSTSTYTDGKKFVVYVNNAKNIIETFELADGETYTIPTGPVLSDYTFMGWSMTRDEVLASEEDTVIVEPIYVLNATYTVEITEGNYTATGAGTYTAGADSRSVVTISTDAADGDGNEFLYWLDATTQETVSYDRTYSFFCVKDTVLTPVYGDASTVTAEPCVRITEVKYNALSGKVSFFAERSVPEEFTLLQTGIVVTKTESIGTNEEVFVVGGTSTAAGSSTSTANNGYYSVNAAVTTGQTVWARAYAIYETADGEILEAYGTVASYTVD